MNAENAAREATVKLQAAIQERRLAEGTLERKSEECERVRTELNELVLKHERAMEGAEANAETAAAAAYEREISNLKDALAREKARGVEAGARLASDAAELRTALDATRREFELEKRSFAAKEFQLVESVEELSSRAALYDKAFAENRHLHNAIQDLKGSIRVFCRVRPHLPNPRMAKRTTSWRSPARAPKGVTPRRRVSRCARTISEATPTVRRSALTAFSIQTRRKAEFTRSAAR